MSDIKTFATEIKGDIDDILAKFEGTYVTPELTIVVTKLDEARTRIVQELQKYAPKPETIVPNPATQDPQTNGQLGASSRPIASSEGTTSEETTPSQTTTSAPQTPAAAPEANPPSTEAAAPTSSVSTTTVDLSPLQTSNTNAEGVANNTPSAQPTA